MARVAGDQDASSPRLVPPAVPRAVDRADHATLRASDAQREEILTELGEGFAQGRLSHETFVFRIEAALRARHQDELDDQVADLRPRRRSPLARARELSRSALSTAEGWLRPGQCGHPPALLLPAVRTRSYTIGREWECDLSISHMTVSRWHAELAWSAGRWCLSDLGSLNGTRLNGWRIAGPTVVRAGDLVTFGTVSFVLAQSPAVSR
jgi:FHA domain/Domain of unknown function (DUF1707)